MAEDDFRVRLEIGDEPAAKRFIDDLRGHGVADEARKRLGDRVVVTFNDGVLTAYADTEQLARDSAALLQTMAAERGHEVVPLIGRWHPDEERWERLEVALPSTPEEHAAEQARLEAHEQWETEVDGEPEWEVRVDLPGHQETVALAQKLEGEGFPLTRRWRFLIVGMPSEQEANALAERLRGEAGPETTISVEAPEVLGDSWRRLHPLSFLGGLGN